MVALAGVTAIELMTAGVTVTEVEPVMEPEVAEIFAEPILFPLTRPVDCNKRYRRIVRIPQHG